MSLWDTYNIYIYIVRTTISVNLTIYFLRIDYEKYIQILLIFCYYLLGKILNVVRFEIKNTTLKKIRP